MKLDEGMYREGVALCEEINVVIKIEKFTVCNRLGNLFFKVPNSVTL